MFKHHDQNINVNELRRNCIINTVKKERAMQLVTLDPHGPNEMRCNGTLSNVPEFLKVSTPVPLRLRDIILR